MDKNTPSEYKNLEGVQILIDNETGHKKEKKES